jgi:hypothetical protein
MRRERPRLVKREFGPTDDDSVQLAVEAPDALERPLNELMGRNAACPHRAGELVKNQRPPEVQASQADRALSAGRCTLNRYAAAYWQ